MSCWGRISCFSASYLSKSSLTIFSFFIRFSTGFYLPRLPPNFWSWLVWEDLVGYWVFWIDSNFGGYVADIWDCGVPAVSKTRPSTAKMGYFSRTGMISCSGIFSSYFPETLEYYASSLDCYFCSPKWFEFGFRGSSPEFEKLPRPSLIPPSPLLSWET